MYVRSRAYYEDVVDDGVEEGHVKAPFPSWATSAMRVED
jgi:hypothetical protein